MTHKTRAKTKTKTRAKTRAKAKVLLGLTFTTIMTTAGVFGLLGLSSKVEGGELVGLSCENIGYANTQSHRQALHKKGFKQEAEKLVQFIEACKVERAGGMPALWTTALHSKTEGFENAQKFKKKMEQTNYGRDADSNAITVLHTRY